MRRLFWPLMATTTIQVIATMVYLTVPILAPALAEELNIEASRIGIYTSLVFVGAALFSTISGPLMTRFGPLRVCQAALLLSALGLATTLFASIPILFLSAIIVGIGYGPATPAGSVILAKVTPPERRGLVFSIKQSGVPLAGMLVGIMVPFLVITSGWRSAVVVMTVAVIAVAILLQPLRRRFDADREPGLPITAASLGTSVALVLRHPDLRRLALACFIFAGAQLCLFSFMVVLLVANAGYSLVAAGAVYAVMQISGVAARIMWGWVADRLLPGHVVLGLIALVSAVFLLLLSGLDSDWSPALVYLVAAVLGISTSGWNGVALAEMARAAPNQIATATAGTIAFTYLGVVVGPASFSAMIEISGGYGLPLQIFAGLSLLAGLWLLIPRATR